MENNNQAQSGFSYIYSAKEQAEIKKIREKYTPLTEVESKMARLRRLDASVTSTAQIAALVCGIIGALILGLGMSLCLTDLGESLGAYKDISMIIGIVLGAFGGVLASLAYPVYVATTNAKRKRVADEILRLSDELLK